jgi:hypothetical protein
VVREEGRGKREEDKPYSGDLGKPASSREGLSSSLFPLPL